MRSKWNDLKESLDSTPKIVSKGKTKLGVADIAVFGMLGAMMYASKVLMEFLPNVHLLATFIVAMTVVYRAKALYPLYIFVILTGLFNGFPMWWIPYVYIWTPLWGVTMLLPRNMPLPVRPFVYTAVCAAHGFLYGILYTPVQALVFGLDFDGMIAWIITGLPWDIVHGIGNLFGSLLVCPLIFVLQKAQKFSH